MCWDCFHAGDIRAGYLTVSLPIGLMELQLMATNQRTAWSWIFPSGRHFHVRAGVVWPGSQ